jgi:hypothetical protein
VVPQQTLGIELKLTIPLLSSIQMTIYLLFHDTGNGGA